MATDREIMDAANKTPANRSANEQILVDEAKRVGNQNASNADHKAQQTQKVWGR